MTTFESVRFVLPSVMCERLADVDLSLIHIFPEYRSKGANALLFNDLIPRYVERGFKWGESQVEMESNAGVQSQWAMFDTVNHKRRRCYKKDISAHLSPAKEENGQAD